MKNINIKIIPYKEMRYDTLGDYWISKNSIEIRIASHNKYGEKLERREIQGFILHELMELFIVMHRKIPIEAIDKFDMEYKGSDPGMNPNAPYHREHMTAMEVEEMFYSEVELT